MLPPLSIASILGSAGPQGFDPMELMRLFAQPQTPQIPSPPSPIQGFGGLPPEVQQQGNRQGILTLATLLGAASPGQIGTAIAQSAGSIDPIRRGFTEDYNQQEARRWEAEAKRAQMEQAFAAQEEERVRRDEMTRTVLQRAGELAEGDPEAGAEIRDLLISSGGDPQAAMGALMEWQAQKEAKAAQEEQQATLANALSSRGIPGEMGMFPTEAGNLMGESVMRDMGLGRYEPEAPPAAAPGTWSSIGSGYVINNRTGETRRAYEPEAEAGGANQQIDWRTGQRFDPETGEVLPAPEGFQAPPPKSDIWSYLEEEERGTAGPGGPRPSFGVAPPPVPEPVRAPGETSIKAKVRAIQQTAADMGVRLSPADLPAIEQDLRRGATVQQVMNQLLGGG